jgi:opacity protein-like surface antigen
LFNDVGGDGFCGKCKGRVYIGAQVPYNMIGGDFDDKTASKVDAGAGIGLIAGYAFIPSVALEIYYSATSHKSGTDTIGLGELSLNGKYSFLAETALQPYLFAGIGSFALGDNSLMLGGTGYNLGIGADYYVSPNVSIGAGLVRKIITYNKVLKSDPAGAVLPKDIKGDTTSLRLDVAYHF